METIEYTCDCGFKWPHGQSGSHQCAPNYRKTIAELRATLAKNEAQMLQMATCAGEFARDASKQAESAPVVAVDVEQAVADAVRADRAEHNEAIRTLTSRMLKAEAALAQRGASDNKHLIDADIVVVTSVEEKGINTVVTIKRADGESIVVYVKGHVLNGETLGVAKLPKDLFSYAAPAAGVPHIERDAARYQWLRHGDNDDKVIQRGPVDPDFVYLPRNFKLDEMIDAAMAAQQGEKGGAA